MWYKIVSNTDIENLMNIFGDFHDSCIKELRYVSGSYVQKDLSMYPINDKRIVRILIQRQYKAPSVIELEFQQVKILNLQCNEHYTSEILDVSFFFRDGYLFWAASDCFEHSPSEYEGFWICAKSARWRAADDYLGQEDVYIDCRAQDKTD